MDNNMEMMIELYGCSPREWHWEERRDEWYFFDPDITGSEFRVFEFDEPEEPYDACSWGATYQPQTRTEGSRFSGRTFTLADRFQTAASVMDHLDGGATQEERFWIDPKFDDWVWRQNGWFQRHDCDGRLWSVYRDREGKRQNWKIVRLHEPNERYNPKADDCHRAFPAAHLAMEHAELHLSYHMTERIASQVSAALESNPDQMSSPVKIDRMPRGDCRRHKPGLYDWFEDPWPEAYRNLDAAMALQ
jgi:hypothetical protein